MDSINSEAGPFPSEMRAGEELVLQRPVVVQPLRWRRSMCAEEWVYLRSRATRPGKVTMLSAQQAAAYYDPEKSKDAYPTRDDYLADIVAFSRREISELIRLGCTCIQIDAPQYAALLDPTMREGYRQRGNDPDAMIDRCIEMDNAIIDGHPGITFAIHICRGNNQSKFYASGDYDAHFPHLLEDAFSPLPPRVRRHSLGRVRAAPPCASGSGGGSGARHHQEAANGNCRGASAAYSRSLALLPASADGAQSAVWLRLHHGGQPHLIEDEKQKLELVASVAREVWGTVGDDYACQQA